MKECFWLYLRVEGRSLAEKINKLNQSDFVQRDR